MALSKSSKAFLMVLVVVAGLVVGGIVAIGSGVEDTELASDQVTVEVPEGAGATTVAGILADEGVIRSETTFRLAARFDGRAGQIQPGTYELTPGMGTGDILDVITAPPEGPETFRVTIPEGLTVEQTLERIAEAEASPFGAEELEDALGGVALPEFVPEDLPEGADAFEGLLFPDTYEFPVEANADEVVARLVIRTEEMLDDIAPPEGYDLYDVLIVASLIERETRVAEERPRVASVVYNRLDAPMRLQIDATVQYARGEHTDRVLFEDLEIESLWNTYEVDGLPPTPISGAGRASIEAAANPEDTDFLFYVVSDLDTGEHAFAETLEEHNANVAEFRRKRDEAEAEGEGEAVDEPDEG